MKDFKKTDRGHMDYRCEGDVMIARWNDNSAVTVGSNCFGVNPVIR